MIQGALAWPCCSQEVACMCGTCSTNSRRYGLAMATLRPASRVAAPAGLTPLELRSSVDSTRLTGMSSAKAFAPASPKALPRISSVSKTLFVRSAVASAAPPTELMPLSHRSRTCNRRAFPPLRLAARAWAPASPSLLRLSHSVVRTVLRLAKALARASTPACPMLFSLRYNLSSFVLVSSARAMAIAPCAPISLLQRSSTRVRVLLASERARAAAPLSPIFSPNSKTSSQLPRENSPSDRFTCPSLHRIWQAAGPSQRRTKADSIVR
mmetsp:Transcript_47224/g.94067  ORF Transcript_47224/g.94067 Transcript_47224/m.94067 type:complete len:268 (-) Transcript_47224:92-895(-)